MSYIIWERETWLNKFLMLKKGKALEENVAIYATQRKE
jgi:hypothetical protein